MKIGKYTIEWHRNLKYWGKNIGYFKKDQLTPYFRFYALFIYIGDISYVD